MSEPDGMYFENKRKTDGKKQKCLEYILTQTGLKKKKTRRQICQFVDREIGDKFEKLLFDRFLEKFRKSGYVIRRVPPENEDDVPHYFT